MFSNMFTGVRGRPQFGAPQGDNRGNLDRDNRDNRGKQDQKGKNKSTKQQDFLNAIDAAVKVLEKNNFINRKNIEDMEPVNKSITTLKDKTLSMTDTMAQLIGELKTSADKSINATKTIDELNHRLKMLEDKNQTYKANLDYMNKKDMNRNENELNTINKMTKLEVDMNDYKSQYTDLKKKTNNVIKYKKLLDRRLELIKNTLGKVDSGLASQMKTFLETSPEKIESELVDQAFDMKQLETKIGGSSKKKIMKKIRADDIQALIIVKMFLEKRIKKKKELIVLANALNLTFDKKQSAKAIGALIMTRLKKLTKNDRKYISML